MTPPIYKTVPYAIDPIVPLVLREDPPAPATFTQDEVNGFLAKEKNAILERFKDYDAIKEQAGKVGELAQQVADLTNAAELADKSKEEQAQIIAQRAAPPSAGTGPPATAVRWQYHLHPAIQPDLPGRRRSSRQDQR